MNITLSGINKAFAKKPLFTDLNLQIEDRQISGIFGASGSGKTTLLNIIGLIEKIDSGTIRYDDSAVVSKRMIRQLHRSKIGFIFQNFGLMENETVRENLLLLTKFDRMSKQAASHCMLQALQPFGLEDKLNAPVNTLSGGEQQRVAISKIILKDCALILADEPTASLDENNKKFVVEQLTQMKERGKTIVLVSHDPSLQRCCDVVINL